MEGVSALNNWGDQKRAFIECYLNKCEANYSSFFVADRDEKGCERLATACANELSADEPIEKGWTYDEKIQFRKDMEEVPELNNFGSNKVAFIECYLNKCEAKFASYDEANLDEEGCTRLAEQCAQDFK